MAPSIKSLISALLLALVPLSSAERELTSTSLNPCQSNNKFTATLFDVVFTPNNGTFAWDIIGVSSITGNITIELAVFAYGLKVYTTTINPCESTQLHGMCPMAEGQLNMNSNAQIPKSALHSVPGE